MANVYEIRVKGHLDARGADWLEGWSMTLHPDGETIMWGPIADQAALYGLLLGLRDLGITLLSVNDVEPMSRGADR